MNEDNIKGFMNRMNGIWHEHSYGADTRLLAGHLEELANEVLKLSKEVKSLKEKVKSNDSTRL